MAYKHGYLLPFVINPDRICIQLEIPNDQRHLLAFWGQLAELGSALNWDNDEEHTALPVAAVWRDVYKIARDKFYGDGCMGCCPDEYQVSYATYYQTQVNYQEYLKMVDDGDTAASFNAPATFDGGEGDDAEFALCRTLNRLISSVFRDAAMQLSEATAVMDAINGAFPTANPIAGILSKVAQTVLADHLKTLAQDCNAIRQVSCCMRDSLAGQSTSIVNIKSALGDCGFDFGSHEAEISAMVNTTLQDTNNARAFIAAMRDDIDSAGSEGGASSNDCECECCEEVLNLIDPEGYGTQITFLGDCKYLFVQEVATQIGDETEPYYHAAVAEATGKCIVFVYDPDMSSSNDDGYRKFEACCGHEDSESIGGWDYARIERIKWTHRAGDRPPIRSVYKVTSVPEDECL